MYSTTFRLASVLVLFSPALVPAQEVKSHPWDPRMQDRSSVLEGYVELRQVVTTEAPKTWSVSEVQPQAGYVGIHLDPPGNGTAYWKIGSVAIDSPAAKAGLKKGDAIIQAGDQNVVDARLVAEFFRGRTAGEKLKLIIERNGVKQDVMVTVEATSRPLSASGPTPTIGITTTESVEGVKVERVMPSSPAETSGIKTGDVITKIDNTPISGSELFTAAIASRKVGDQIQLVVKRANEELKISLKTSANTGNDGRRGGGGGNQRWDERTATTFKKDVYRLAIVPIEYTDVKHNPRFALSDWERMLFSTGNYVGTSPSGQPVYGSMNDFYREQSYGKFRVEGQAFQWITVNKKRAEYANDTVRNALLTEALDKILARDGSHALDGYDGIFFIYAGGRYQTNRGGLYWPHRSNQFYNGKRWAYFICPESEGGNNERFSTNSVLTHEFGHMLGLPDLYARPEAPGSEGLGIWCTMANGHGQAGRPRHFSAWCKEAMGWSKPTVVDPTVPQHVVLGPITSGDKECLKILVRKDGSEYLLLENRYARSFDKDLPAEGLLIWRIVDGRPLLEESHGIAGPEGPGRFLTVIPFPSLSNNSFTPYTTPSSRSQKGGGLPVNITNIRRLPDGRVAFDLGIEYY
ncbi:MAG: M6 family metalloprotease domain-containing protein [Gemmatales bacterium]